MTAFWRDRQVRAAALLLTLVFAAFTAAGCLLLNRNAAQTSRALLQQDVALAGGMVRGKAAPELSILTGRIDGQDLAAGERLLSPYGYGENTPPAAGRCYENLFGTQISLFCLLAALLYLTALGLLLFFFVRSDRRLREFAESVEAGDFSREGDLVQDESGFGVLRSAVAALAEKTGFHADALQKDKEYLKDLLSDISHQMKTPLAALRMYHEILLESPGLSPEKREEFLRRSQAQVERTDWLVQSLLKMARLESGAAMMNRRQAYLLDTVDLAAAPFEEPAKQKGVALASRVPADIRFAHDADWVAEAIGNLVKNALEHTPPGGHVLVEADETPLSVELRVADDGEGMAREEIPRAFERFYRADSQKCGGAGIGLSLSKEILEKNGGEIFVQSRPGEGSVFTVTFLKDWRPPETGNLKEP